MVSVVEPLVSALFGQLFKILASHHVRDFFKSDKTLIDKLKTTLLTVDAVFNDAEEKQIMNPAVKEWLNELKHAAYDADDLLDEVATAALKRKLETEANYVKGRAMSMKKEMLKQCSNLNPFYNGIKDRLQNIVERLENLANQRDLLNLKGSLRVKTSPVWRTTSLLDESLVFGRDKDKEELLKFLLSDTAQENGIPVIAIVGIAGVGKTTLAQLLYNDPNVMKHFREFRAWAHVSEELDVFKVTRTIFESVISRGCHVTDLNVLQVVLKKRLTGKRFLLVLDDIWNENLIDWDLLSAPLKAGACGSRIIVTTRNIGVASIMHAAVTHRLPHLSDEDCWSLFAKHAFRTSNPDEHPSLKRIGAKIVKKCRGIPLAAKTLGGLLHSEEETEEWSRILNSKIWDLPNDKSKILPALKLSYYHLHPHLKQCFAYCSILPKGYEFEKEKLILLWMAEGFLQQPNGEKTMEETGDKYFRELLSRSFFQESSCHKKQCFVMHDLVNDLAQFASGEFCCKLEQEGKPNGLSEKTRHFAWLMNRLDGPDIFEALHEVKSMRTFLRLGSSNTSCSALSKIVSDQWLPEGKHLRVLSFSGCAIIKLPNLCKLIHLRYLDLSYTSIRELQSSICSLYNLQTLLLSSCYNLTGLPEKIGNLINLRHLDVSETNMTKMPVKFGKLKNLHELTDFFVGKDIESSKISELGKLLHLHGTLSISKLENVVDSKDASEANLRSKKHLNELIFKWTTTTHQVMNEEVLENLQPHENLKKLTIESYCGKTFPYWLGDGIFSNMVIIRLSKCINCELLPSLGQLSSLQELYIAEMKGLKLLGKGFYRHNNFGIKPFKSLKILSFINLPHWREWTHEGEDLPFPSLQELKIQECPELIKSLPEHLNFLTKLELSNCPKLLPFSDGQFPIELQSVVITNCNNLTPHKQWGLHGMKSLTSFDIEGGCSKVELFPEEQLLPNTLTSLRISELPDLKILGCLTFLENLEINYCEKLESMPKEGLSSNLQSLIITNCDNLMPQKDWGLHGMKFLTCFEIEGGCSKMELFPNEGVLPNTLTSVRIKDLPNLKILGEGLRCLISLKKMEINCCEKLESMPKAGLPHKLQSLSITNCKSIRPSKKWGLHGMKSLTHFEITGGCSKVELFPKEGLLPDTLISLSINSLPDLKYLVKGLQHLSSLEKLEIKYCRKLESFQAERLPTSLSSLYIQNCSLLAPRCRKEEGEDWHKLSHISDLKID